VERYVTGQAGTQSGITALGVTSLTTSRAAPERLAGLIRDHRPPRETKETDEISARRYDRWPSTVFRCGAC